MSNTNKNAINISGSAGKASNFLPYVAAAIVVIVIALAVFMAPQAQAPANPGTQPSATQGAAALPPVSNKMSEKSCGFVYGVVMDNACTGGLFPLGEVESTGTKKFCCGKSVNLEKQATGPLPITPPAGYVAPSNALPEVAVQNISVPPAPSQVQPETLVIQNTSASSNGTLLGGDRDAHGCIPSAGYTWCEAKQKCYRPFEENCTAGQNQTTSNISMAVANATPAVAKPDSKGCMPSEGYTWCEDKQKCLRAWEESCPSLQNLPGVLNAPGGKQAGANATAPRLNSSAPLNITNVSSNGTRSIGSDHDSHGCIPSAGYSWCNAKQMCIRSSDENCTAAAPEANTGIPANVTTIPINGSDVAVVRDSHGCITPLGYTWCAVAQRCYLPTVENCTSQ